MERLAYGHASGIQWKKDVSKDLNQTLRVLLALISSRLLQAKFKTHLSKLRKEHGQQWKSLWVDKMLANMELFGNQEEEERLAYEVDLAIAKLEEKRKTQDASQKKKD